MRNRIMRKSILSLSLCLLAAMTMTAQEVDKTVVTGNAEAAAKAGADLKKLEEGEKAWKFDGTVGLNAAATGLVNWAAGGKNNVNGIAYAKLHLLYHKNALAWETNFDTDFGLTWIDQSEDAFQKSSDNIKLATKFGWEFKKNWYLTVLGSFQSQYAPGRNYITGYNPIISKWLAPSYTDISVGIDYKYSYKGADFSLYISPIAGRISTAYIGNRLNEKYTKEAWLAGSTPEEPRTEADWNENLYQRIMAENMDVRSELQRTIGTTYYGADGMEHYRNFRAEFGFSLKGAIAYTYKDFKLSTTLALFTPYQGKGFNVKDAWMAADPQTHTEDAWAALPAADRYFTYSNKNRFIGMFDVDWDVAMSYQFLKCLQVTLQTSLKYYPGTLIANKEGVMAERVQFKGVIGIGVGYSF